MDADESITCFDLWLAVLAYWITMFQYPIDMGKVNDLQNDLNAQRRRIDQHDEAIYGGSQ